MTVKEQRLDYLLVKARSAALHLGILKNRIYSNMSFIECITFLDALKIAAKVVKEVKKENIDFITRHFEVIKG